MKKIIALSLIIIFFIISIPSVSFAKSRKTGYAKSSTVRGYTRKNGTYVHSHTSKKYTNPYKKRKK